MKKVTPRPPKKRIHEYGENEFDRSARMYSGGSKDAGMTGKPGHYNAWNLDQVEHSLEIVEDNLSKLKSNLSTDSNLSTNDKLRYIHIIDNIEAELNSAQEDLDFKPS